APPALLSSPTRRSSDLSSPSASGRSNGNRFVSANAATMKMKYASDRGNTNQMDCAWRATTSESVTLPASSSTATVVVARQAQSRSEEHTSELQSLAYLV